MPLTPKIFERENTTVGLNSADSLFGEPACVKGIGALASDCLKRLGVSWPGRYVADVEELAMRGKDGREQWILRNMRFRSESRRREP